MESRPQNPEFRNNPENFHPCNWQVSSNFVQHGPGRQGILPLIASDM